MATPTVVDAASKNKELEWQTGDPPPLDRKGLIRTVANPPEAIERPAVTAITNRADLEIKHPENTRAVFGLQQTDELRSLPRAVRRIGYGWRKDPEAIAIAKDGISKAFMRLALRLGGAA